MSGVKGPGVSYIVLAIIGLINIYLGLALRLLRGEMLLDPLRPEFIGAFGALVFLTIAHAACLLGALT